MTSILSRFLADEQGVVTVDWVVLTSVAAVFGVVVMLTLGTGTTDVGAAMETSLVNIDVVTLGTLGHSR
ncbi:Flp family type IVb pilin [Pararhodobacter sp. CCB-MM2]|uniref:Flp family type IVb pilin n=1 Tax=Pararhodobacter sp. CCB-MM2 TaxID=1786003 RepID=UPI00082FE564|nr:hypothetical protein [Pararhodobacter sp. CCB-MM2]